MFCQANSIIVEKPQAFGVRPLWCKRWTCDDCGPRRRWQLFKQGLGGKPTLFLTLTANPAYGVSNGHRAQMLVLAWRKLRRRLLDAKVFDKIPFLSVFEATKRGEPHLHVLLRIPYLDQKIISKHMAFEMGAPIVFIEKIDNKKKAAAYVSKYTSKCPKPFAGCKRYFASRDYAVEPKKERAFKKAEGLISIVKKSIEKIVDCARFQRCPRLHENGWTWVNDKGDLKIRRWILEAT